MPVSVKYNPFNAPPAPKPPETGLRVPQARVLRALLPDYPEDPKSEWPLLNRAALGVKAGYTAISGTITRALNGIAPGSSSGDPHLGLIARGLVEVEEVDVEGVKESNYRITENGIIEVREYIKLYGDKLPPVRDAAACTNERYNKKESASQIT